MRHENIREEMEVVGSDGKQIGTVEQIEGDDFIKLSNKGPSAGGKHHLIPVDWVDHVDQKVHLKKSAVEAIVQWQVAA
jgi:hypothetical protein